MDVNRWQLGLSYVAQRVHSFAQGSCRCPHRAKSLPTYGTEYCACTCQFSVYFAASTWLRVIATFSPFLS
jgi:hypothetical protein